MLRVEASLVAMILGISACTTGGGASPSSAAADASQPHDGAALDALPDAALVDTGPPWTPGMALPSLHDPRRETVDVRGLVHEHSVHSHDACDNAPVDALGNIDQQCFDDFRTGMCAAAHDYIMLTDHSAMFSDTEFPETLLYRPDRGDALVERDASPVANRAACPDGSATMILAGTESGTMSVGLEKHPVPAAERQAFYDLRTADSIAAMHSVNAVALVAHTEDFTPEELVSLPLDGFEMYNLHANLMLNLGKAVDLLGKVNQPDHLMASDLVIASVLSEDPRYLTTWGTVLSRGARRVTTMGTDAHRNTFDIQLPDGDRIDSYARMNRWFSNHLLIRPDAGGTWDDRALKDALRSGRLYGVFEYLGYAEGFDFHAEEETVTREMGEEASIGRGASLVIHLPAVRRLDPTLDAPEIAAVLYRAVEGGWEHIADAAGADTELRHVPTTPGAYRTEIRMTPHHLATHLHDFVDFASKQTIWIYSNPIYVVD